MKSKRRLAVLLGLTLLALHVFVTMKSVHRGPFCEEPRSAPVVIFVVIDTLRADRTSLCGYEHPTTPNLEELVESGATYACNSHSPSTWTLPSHASFFTGVGLEGHQSGDGGGPQRMKWGGVTPLGPELPTLAEEMSARGYQTLLLTGNPVVSERLGLTRGFDHVAIGRTYPMMHDHRLADRLVHDPCHPPRADPQALATGPPPTALRVHQHCRPPLAVDRDPQRGWFSASAKRVVDQPGAQAIRIRRNGRGGGRSIPGSPLRRL